MMESSTIGYDLAEEIRRLVKEAVARLQVGHIVLKESNNTSSPYAETEAPGLPSNAEKVVADALISDIVSALFAEHVREAERLLDDSTKSHRSLWEVLMSLCDDRAQKLQRVEGRTPQRGIKDLKDKIVPQLVKSYPWLHLCATMGPFKTSAKHEGRLLMEVQQQLIDVSMALREKVSDLQNEQHRHQAVQTELSKLSTEFDALKELLEDHRELLRDERRQSASLEHNHMRQQNLAHLAADAAQNRGAMHVAWLRWINYSLHDWMRLCAKKLHDMRMAEVMCRLCRNYIEGKQMSAFAVWKCYSAERSCALLHQAEMNQLRRLRDVTVVRLEQKILLVGGLRQWECAASISKFESLVTFTREGYERRLDEVRGHAQYRSILCFARRLRASSLRTAVVCWKELWAMSKAALYRWARLDISANKHRMWVGFAGWRHRTHALSQREKVRESMAATVLLKEKYAAMSHLKSVLLREREVEYRTGAAQDTLNGCLRSAKNVQQRILFKHYKRWMQRVDAIVKADMMRGHENSAATIGQLMLDHRAYMTLHEIQCAFDAWKGLTSQAAIREIMEQRTHALALVSLGHERAKYGAALRRTLRIRRGAFVLWKDQWRLHERRHLEEQLRMMRGVLASNERLQRIELGLSNIGNSATQRIRRTLKKGFREWLLQVLLERDMQQDLAPVLVQQDKPSREELSSQAARLKAMDDALSQIAWRISHRVSTIESLQPKSKSPVAFEVPLTRVGVANLIFRVTAKARSVKQLCLQAHEDGWDDDYRLWELEEAQKQIQELVTRCENEWREHFSPYLKIPLKAALP
jgi:hypothetical protein